MYRLRLASSNDYERDILHLVNLFSRSRTPEPGGDPEADDSLYNYKQTITVTV